MAAIPVDPREELERLERKHAENPEGRYFVPLADAYRRSGDLSGAIDLLRSGLARHPEYLSAHVVLGRCYADGGEIEAAEAEFRHVLSLDPQNLIALRTLGDIALVDGRRREAARWYQDLIAVDPMNDDARAALSRLHTEAVDLEGTEESVSGDGDADEPQSDTGTGFEQPVPERYEIEDGVGGMMDLKSDDDRGAFFDDGPDVVVTETIAQLYTRQGFFDRAADVYRELIRRRGGDAALEAKLRRVEALAAGAPDPEIVGRAPQDVGDDSRESESESSDPDGGASSEVGLPAVPAMEDGGATRDITDPFYPLIGPVGESDGGELAEMAAGVDEAQPDVPPAYDFATAAPSGSEATGSTPDDDLDGLLLDPFSDPFAPATPVGGAGLSARSFAPPEEGSTRSVEAESGDGLAQDPFADSFVEGFPAIDDETSATGGAIPIAGIANLGDDDSPSTAPSAPLTISAFLKAVAKWKPSASVGAAHSMSEASESLSGPGAEGDAARQSGEAPFASSPYQAAEGESSAAEPEAGVAGAPDGWSGPIAADDPRSDSDRPDPLDDGSEEAGTTGVSSGWQVEELEFDSALGHAPVDAGASRLPEAVEPSGADDLQLVSDADDLFPWEIPLPEAGSQPLPSVEPLDLDPGYPFDDTSQGDAPYVDSTVHAERTPSEAVAPDPTAELDEPAAEFDELRSGQLSPESEPAISDAGFPYDLDDEVNRPPSTPASTRDDDDLESFQAWLRSLKR